MAKIPINKVHGRDLQVGHHCCSLGSVKLCVGRGLSGKKGFQTTREKTHSCREEEEFLSVYSSSRYESVLSGY